MTKQMIIVLNGRLPDLNQALKSAYSWRGGFGSLKKETEYNIKWQIMTAKPFECFDKKVHITYKWYELNRLRDKDNIAFAKKFINDALVSLKILHDDGWKHVDGFTDLFFVDKKNPRIEITIKEVCED
jgi:Holliday junction resolvase RusA-like endonuclease